MCLRFSVTLITGTVLAVSTLAHAKTTPAPAVIKSPAPPALPVSAMAQIEGIISYCQSVDPHSSAKYKQLGDLVLSGQSSQLKSDDEKGAAYQSDLSAVRAELAKIAVSKGVSTCKAGIAGL